MASNDRHCDSISNREDRLCCHSNGSLPVSATVSNTCAFGTISTLDFGAYDPSVAHASTGSHLDAQTTFALTCTDGASITIGLDNGTHASGGERFLDSGGNKLRYVLYSNAARTTAWDSITNLVSDTGTGSSKTYTVYGRIEKGQTAPVGSYSDTVSIKVNY